MEKIVNFKLLQIVLTLAFIWQLRSFHQFCGTFTDPKAFLHDISIGHCKSFTLIGRDSKSGEFGVVFNEQKLHDQLLLMNSTNGQPTGEQQHHQFMDELADKLVPPAGRHCIPITISPSIWIGLDRNFLDNGSLFYFSIQLCFALLSLVPLGLCTVTMLQFEEGIELHVYLGALASVICWCVSAVCSSNLLLYWTNFWVCANFRADQTNVPLVTLVFSIVMACLSVFEIFFKISLLIKRPVCMCASTAAETVHHKLRNDVATECANVIIHHQQQKKNGNAVM